MKKTILTVALVVASIVTLSSLSYNDARAKNTYGPQINFTVPVAPKSTIVTDGLHVKRYLKKGYQIQNAWYNNTTYENMYVVVKY
jgi:hypothetical protein